MESRIQSTEKPAIKLIGIGGGGCHFLNYAIENGLQDIDPIAIDTDPQALQTSSVQKKICLGNNLRRGLDGNSDPEWGGKAAEYSSIEIGDTIQNAELVVLVSTLGGGTGSGAAPVVARLAKESGALTIAIVTQPFNFEGKRRVQNGIYGEAALRNNVDALAVYQNNQLLSKIDRNTRLSSAFKIIDDLLFQGIKSTLELCTSAGGGIEAMRAVWGREKQTFLTSGNGSSSLSAIPNVANFNITDENHAP
jgi:cell division protein FtsZ